MWIDKEESEEEFDDFNMGHKSKREIDWDEEPDEDEHFKINSEKKRPPTTQEYIDRYGFGVE